MKLILPAVDANPDREHGSIRTLLVKSRPPFKRLSGCFDPALVGPRGSSSLDDDDGFVVN
jgi:hypothetical protein